VGDYADTLSFFQNSESGLKIAATAMGYEIGIFKDPQHSLFKILYRGLFVKVK
jgi:hypothetical protein